ncbi:hypothetical protein [Jiella mangrovi]|uniref:Uncharacterized protein n=1 Tax=Jiella mangrovi TaxID=2821407 RepID=A0ABS4BM48_9HYPH|nr:hypothetical protein [Jiella mangrovi]MBP0617801.1 hypothetical protein [Jiella mangrovi]
MSNEQILLLSRLFRNAGIVLLIAGLVFAPFRAVTVFGTEPLSWLMTMLVILGGFCFCAAAFWIIGRLR